MTLHLSNRLIAYLRPTLCFLFVFLIISRNFNCLGQINPAAQKIYEKASEYLAQENIPEYISYIKKAAALNHSEALNDLGTLYLTGYETGVPDYIKALEWFKKAADLNNPNALCNIGSMYFQGLGVEQNFDEAFKWFSKSAEQGNIAGLVNLGICYHSGLGTPQDFRKAEELYLKAIHMPIDDGLSDYLKVNSEFFIANAELQLGTMYENGLGVPVNPDKAMGFYQKAAGKGNSFALEKLGEIYYIGKGHIQKDYGKAYNFFKEAAELDNAQAQNFMGYLCLNGWGVARDYEKAFYWFSVAADNGWAEAMNNLGYMYLEGLGLEKNYTLAMNWFLKAAELDLGLAQNNVGHMYENGLGCHADYTKALEWYAKAYENGYQEAQNAIAVLNSKTGSGVPAAPVIATDRSIALVIGNSDYLTSPLSNPKNDAEDMVKKLKRQDIKVISCFDGTTSDINNVLADFCKEAANYDAAIFYYSGHGFQKDGENYILPVNAEINGNDFTPEKCVSINDLIGKINLSGVKKKIIILDACRTLSNTARDAYISDEGLADMQHTTGLPEGTFVIYATGAGKLAEDGIGERNSPFTSAILKMIDRPNLDIRRFAVNVCQEVALQTHRRQIPSYNDNMVLRDFYFNVTKQDPGRNHTQ